MVLTYHNLLIKSDNFSNPDRMKSYIEYMFKNLHMEIEYDSVTNSTDVVAEILPDSPETTNPEDSKPFGKDDMAMLIWK